MLRTQPYQTIRHGWHIEIAAAEDVFLFECCPPNQQEACNDGMCYPTQAAALTAACEFVDREIALLALIEAANEWLASGLISEDEYWNLTDFA